MHMSTDKIEKEDTRKDKKTSKQGAELVIALPKDVDIQLSPQKIIVKGPKGSSERTLKNPDIKIEVKDKLCKIKTEKGTKKEHKIIGTLSSHIKNMIKGVEEKYVYKLKICSGHFPMNVASSKTDITVKNFLGEKIPRVLNLPGNVDVKVEGSEVIVESTNKETAGQVAASIEKLCRITNRDRRIFQDGIWIVNKGGKEV